MEYNENTEHNTGMVTGTLPGMAASTAVEVPAPFLSREIILRADDIKEQIVDVPEWGGRITVRGLTGSERDRFEQSVMTSNTKGDRALNIRNMRAKLVALSCVDQQGSRLFANSDVAVLGEKSAAALQRVYDAAARLSGISKDDAEELAKNSSSDPSGGLSSD